ncbi:MAG: hypothetical protein ACJZ9F_03760 [Rhodospirillaceae bacterium]
MPDFPIQVLRIDSGNYTASLVDLSDGPIGQGIDPYGAVNDLFDTAWGVLEKLYKENALPAPSAVDDRPVISFDPGRTRDYKNSRGIDSAAIQWRDKTMINYSWTNSAIIYES